MMVKFVFCSCFFVLGIGASTAAAQSCCNRPAPGSLSYKATSRKPTIVLPAPIVESPKTEFSGSISTEKPGASEKLLFQELKADYSYKLEANGFLKDFRTQLASGKLVTARVTGTVFTKDGYYWIRATKITVDQKE